MRHQCHITDRSPKNQEGYNLLLKKLRFYKYENRTKIQNSKKIEIADF